jgi:hypothetical protein
MKTFVAIILGLAALAIVFLFAVDRGERRAKFIGLESDLKQAHLALQRDGGFTNFFRNVNVYPYTNLITIDGTNYQCEFAAEHDWFKERGLLTITTNEEYIWIDKKQGLIRLAKPPSFPPGF